MPNRIKYYHQNSISTEIKINRFHFIFPKDLVIQLGTLIGLKSEI